MVNENLNTALFDLVNGIRGQCLGSVESVVIHEAGKALISNWNDHNSDDPIDEALEMKEWENECS
jgi:hypothetical protein